VNDRRREAQDPLLGHPIALIGKQLRGERGIRAERLLRIAQLAPMQRLQVAQVLRALDLGREFGGLLVALDQRALDFPLLFRCLCPARAAEQNECRRQQAHG
jgi:hypothetical protein